MWNYGRSTSIEVQHRPQSLEDVAHRVKAGMSVSMAAKMWIDEYRIRIKASGNTADMILRSVLSILWCQRSKSVG